MVLGAIEIDGKHSGKNLAAYFLHIIEALGLKTKLFCVTADNASNNWTLAKELEYELNYFNAEENLLGCVGHVLNLAAKAGLKVMLPKAKEANQTNREEV